jgi:hypothetical protein
MFPKATDMSGGYMFSTKTFDFIEEYVVWPYFIFRDLSVTVATQTKCTQSWAIKHSLQGQILLMA